MNVTLAFTFQVRAPFKQEMASDRSRQSSLCLEKWQELGKATWCILRVQEPKAEACSPLRSSGAALPHQPETIWAYLAGNAGSSDNIIEI